MDYYVSCPRCGQYSITDECVSFKQKELEKIGYILSALSREINEGGITIENRPNFMTTNINEYLKHHLIPDVSSVEEKTKKLLHYLRRKTDYFGQVVELDPETDYQLAYAKHPEEFMSFAKLLSDKEYAEVITTVLTNGQKQLRIKLTANGWELGNSLSKKNVDLDQGFIAMWFHDDMLDKRDTISDAIREVGFKPYCIWNEHFAERIMDKALGSIRNSRFIIVDLTGSRGSVFFEAGFAHGLGIETIYVYDQTKIVKRKGT